MLIEDLKKSKESCTSENIYKQYGHKFMSSRYEVNFIYYYCIINILDSLKLIILPNLSGREKEIS